MCLTICWSISLCVCVCVCVCEGERGGRKIVDTSHYCLSLAAASQCNYLIHRQKLHISPRHFPVHEINYQVFIAAPLVSSGTRKLRKVLQLFFDQEHVVHLLTHSNKDYSQLPLNGHLVKADTSNALAKRTRKSTQVCKTITCVRTCQTDSQVDSQVHASRKRP